MTAKKEKFIQIRINDKEKKKLQQQAKENGFDSVSTYILWLCRKYAK